MESPQSMLGASRVRFRPLLRSSDSLRFILGQTLFFNA